MHLAEMDPETLPHLLLQRALSWIHQASWIRLCRLILAFFECFVRSRQKYSTIHFI